MYSIRFFSSVWETLGDVSSIIAALLAAGIAASFANVAVRAIEIGQTLKVRRCIGHGFDECLVACNPATGAVGVSLAFVLAQVRPLGVCDGLPLNGIR